jgi:hypothetical protein
MENRLRSAYRRVRAKEFGENHAASAQKFLLLHRKKASKSSKKV